MSVIKRHKKIVVLLVLILGFVLWKAWDGHFTPERWAKTDGDQRGKLVHSLLEQYNGLVGMSQAEVEALLGSDADGEQVEEQLTTEGSTVRPLLVYQAGGRPWAMFPEYLFIYLEDGYVTEAKLIAD